MTKSLGYKAINKKELEHEKFLTEYELDMWIQNNPRIYDSIVRKVRSDMGKASVFSRFGNKSKEQRKRIMREVAKARWNKKPLE